ncbi:MAG: hypothetical protein KBG58_07700, partial [Giesbergeria sp.]|nr:hypothetical protein [Giesbergeria sp.]
AGAQHCFEKEQSAKKSWWFFFKICKIQRHLALSGFAVYRANPDKLRRAAPVCRHVILIAASARI